jgi:DNA modification methylase
MEKREKPYTIFKKSLKTQYYQRAKAVSGTYTNRFPSHLIKIPRVQHKYSTRPVELCEYFIKTFSDENDTILDLTCSNAQSAIACHRLKRNYIGIDINPDMVKDAIENLKKNGVEINDR